MPKIIIKEIDNTKAGSTEYSNFTVVVPGFASNGYDASRFDENDICEFKSQSDFVNTVGKRAGKVAYLAAEAATVSGGPTTLTAKLFFDTWKDEAYVIDKEVSEEDIGRLVIAGTDESGSSDEVVRYYKVKKATEDDLSASRAAYHIEKGNEGKDTVETLQNGNQIAYELLGLGYTVLYKLIKETSEAGETVGIDLLKTDTFWSCLRDRTNYDFRYVCSGGVYDDAVYAKMVSVTKYINNISLEDNGRGDCFALLDIDEHQIENKINPIGEIRSQVEGWESFLGKDGEGKYAAIFVPTVTYVGDVNKIDTYQNLTFPASFHYLACAAKAFERYNEWYAVAGYNRGYSEATIDHTSLRLGDIAVQLLQIRPNDDDIPSIRFCVNPVTCVRGKYYIWGNRTAHSNFLTDVDGHRGLKASSFLNVRQLCCTLKKEIHFVCKQLTFDPNSDVLWVNFCNKVRPILEKMKGDQGIEDYKLVKVKTNVKAMMKAKVKIVPVVATEDFGIDVYLEDSVSGITVDVEEE